MAAFRKTLKFVDYFDRAQALTATAGVGGWTVVDTSSSGTPTYLIETGLGMVLTCAATSEAEIITMHHDDVLQFDIDEIQNVTWYLRVNGIDAVTTLVVGVAGAQNDTSDTVAQSAWFRMEGSASTTAVVVETDDGTNNNDDVATGTTLAAVIKKFTIDFGAGKSDVRFYIDGEQVGSATTFDMSNYSGGLQPYVQSQKASGTGVPDVELHGVEILYSKVFD